MGLTWIFIESFAIIIETLAIVYFLNSRFVSKAKPLLPLIIAWIALTLWGLFATFISAPVLLYDGVTYALLLLYLMTAKHGSIWQKLFSLILTYAISMGSSLLGAGVASFLTNSSVEHTQVYQDTSRLVAIILIKAIQVAVYFALSKRQIAAHIHKRKTSLILAIATIITLACMAILFINIPEFDLQMVNVITWLAVGFLVVLIVIFLLYEMFVLEESKNIDLSTRLHRLELESHFYSELSAMYTDLRTWRHEYNNNMLALHALVKHGDEAKVLDYIEGMRAKREFDEDVLQTGNVVLDAVVSAKAIAARSHNITVSLQAVYPEDNYIDDNDLCAISGNLLDNAIEACLRMDDSNRSRFITFSLLVKGKNLVLTITNSFDGRIKKYGTRYLTSKDRHYHGIGIEYVDSIIEKYEGYVLREHNAGVFETHVMIPLISSQDAVLT